METGSWHSLPVGTCLSVIVRRRGVQGTGARAASQPMKRCKVSYIISGVLINGSNWCKEESGEKPHMCVVRCVVECRTLAHLCRPQQ
jgi:hypothetical protein